MFSKLAIIVASMAVFAAALPSGPSYAPNNSITNSCNGGKVRCCTEYQGSKTYANSIWATLGIPIDLEAAFGCDPLVDILGGESCTNQNVCCSDNSFNSFIALGCTPLNVNA